ncbi:MULTISPECIES: hypothetical protein [Streptomyces]|uniref:Chorismate-pyruvate lyase n=3 Tax=Streptomyces TaxID=1883 RepID=A0ABT9KSD1_9ACTN|nr:MULTISPECIES: hypothetical protein [Streptomyces]ABC42541.1 putative chorismate lyase [Streptomyces hygroscopicus]MBW8086517.1 hypothetical protein [Streptomyces hygroscopicus subsp. hygroscopicus]MCO8306010.1 hypothetical protein [Streptomyces sp. RKCA744]MDN3057170.1 hypothetical protein [Streptomyces sp. SRF1]MDP9611338.1 chorismate-pyruvate lyase [Streptomyces demainii]
MTDRLKQFSSAPPQTRMLVCADGSTTVLLDALVGERVSVRVDHQRRVPAARVRHIGCHILGASPGTLVIDRRSSILTSGKDVISVNRVVIAGRDSQKLVPPPEQPLGPYLKTAGFTLTREPIDVSRDIWPLDSAAPACVSKEYVIDCGSAGRVYVHEKFNPGFVPLGRDGSSV